ncbi:MAG TPA: sugar phosphate nucleotidyltransferase [Rickettsiales bacterium]|nr:sugar phosphate nucleotidyltransferase [Rickettsiales bacterium]
MKVVIQAGGNGTRLWPISRKNKPKQFVKLLNNETLFSQTVKRFQSFGDDLIILGNNNHKDLINEEIKINNLKNPKVFLEPKAMNTAPSICVVVQYLMNNNSKDEIVVFCPSDHYMNDIESFINSLKVGEKFAKEDKVICFGIQPLYPETGYGYIKVGEKINDDAFYVDRFVEKPNIERAIEFLKDGGYLWNGGIFMAKVSVLYELFNKYQKSLLKNIELTLKNSKEKNNIIFLNKEYFEKVEEISMDYAIIENLNSSNLVTVPLKLIWSDVGNYKSLFDIDNDKTKDKNVISGRAILYNTENCLIRSDKKIICCSDVEDLVIVEEGDTILIMKKDKSQNIKKLIEKCKEENFGDLL